MLRLRTLKQYGLLLALLAGFSMASAAERVALVIGNSAYAHAAHLNNPPRDAQAIARALTGLGFQVTGPLLNQSKAQMDAALKQFGRQAQGATAAVVYFSGHGVEVRGQNYLLPTDAVLERERDVALEGVGLEVVVDQLGGASGYRLVILDACRDNPLAAQMQRTDGTRSTYRGLAPIEVSGQTYVAYAARAGQRAQDGRTGEHSPYAAALLKYLKEPLALPNLFGAVREEVRRATNGEQEPWLYGAFGREPIYLAGLKPEPVPVSPSPAVDHDHEAWKSAENCGTAACYRAYLKTHPQGRYAEMARARLEPAAVVASPFVRMDRAEYRLGDSFRLVFGATEDGYVHVFLREPDGSLVRLLEREVRANRAYEEPGTIIEPAGPQRVVVRYSRDGRLPASDARALDSKDAVLNRPQTDATDFPFTVRR